MYITLYQWQLKPGKEQQFIEAWTRLTTRLQNTAPQVSAKLLKTLQGEWVALIEWPSQKEWESQTNENIDLLAQKSLMECVQELQNLVPMEVVKNLKPRP